MLGRRRRHKEWARTQNVAQQEAHERQIDRRRLGIIHVAAEDVFVVVKVRIAKVVRARIGLRVRRKGGAARVLWALQGPHRKEALALPGQFLAHHVAQKVMHLLRRQVTHKPRLVCRLGLAATSLLCLLFRLRFCVCRGNRWRQQVLAGVASELRAGLRTRARGRHLVLQVAKPPRRWRSGFLRQLGRGRATPRAARLTTTGDGRAAAHREEVA